MSETVEKLLDAAEKRVRTGGFHAVSFRDLATDLGIKSASVHYHFPRKEDLAVAMITRYAERIFAALEIETAGAVDAEDRLHALARVYRAALTSTNQACLCGIMGAEALGLPPPVRKAVRGFLDANVAWVADALTDHGAAEPEDRAAALIAALQGAMMLSVNLGDTALFDRIAEQSLTAALA